MKKIISVILSISALVLLFIACHIREETSTNIVNYTISNNYKIEASFKKAVSFVEDFKSENSRLPANEEFELWTERQSSQVYSPRGMSILTNPERIKLRLYDPYDGFDRTEDFGEPPEGSYIIILWRGEWSEYYISWKDTTTLNFDPRDYYMFGNARNDFLFFIFLFLITAMAAIGFCLSSRGQKKATK